MWIKKFIVKEQQNKKKLSNFMFRAIDEIDEANSAHKKWISWSKKMNEQKQQQNQNSSTNF